MGPATDHSGPRNTVLGQKSLFFVHFGAKKAVFFGDGGSEKLDNLLRNLAKHVFFCESSTLKIGWGSLQLPTQAPKTLIEPKKWLFLAIFGQKMGFFW